jgi:outer membrane murein-binding lipoprotein Lpp
LTDLPGSQEDAAQNEAARAEQEADRLAQHLTQDPELGEEWLRQDNLIYGGLIAIGIVFVQALLPYPLDTAAMTSVLAFAVAIPLLAALIMVNRHERFRRRRTSSRTVAGARAVAQGAAFLGLVAGFWHLHWIVGAVFLGSSLIALGVHSAGFTTLESQLSTPDQEDPPGKQHSEDGDADGS